MLGGKIEYSQGKYAEARGRLSTLTSDENTWRFSAMESLALIDIAEGNIGQALIRLTSLANEHAAPSSIKQRSEELKQLLEQQISTETEAEKPTNDASEAPEESK